MSGVPFPDMTGRRDGRSLPALVFITPQAQITDVLDAGAALRAGTLFPELNKPFTGRRGEL
jgi:hypothetical protein